MSVSNALYIHVGGKDGGIVIRENVLIIGEGYFNLHLPFSRHVVSRFLVSTQLLEEE
jgi:hypothetical protein